MARSQNSFMKKLKAEKKRKKKMEKFERKLEKKHQETSGKLKDMIAYVDEFGNISDTPPEEEEVKDAKNPKEIRENKEKREDKRREF